MKQLPKNYVIRFGPNTKVYEGLGRALEASGLTNILYHTSGLLNRGDLHVRVQNGRGEGWNSNPRCYNVGFGGDIFSAVDVLEMLGQQKPKVAPIKVQVFPGRSVVVDNRDSVSIFGFYVKVAALKAIVEAAEKMTE